MRKVFGRFFGLCPAVFIPALLMSCGDDGTAPPKETGAGAFEQKETIEQLKKEVEILEWELVRLRLKIAVVDGAELVKDKRTGRRHHDVEREGFTGRAVQRFPDGSLQYEASFLEGLEDGMKRAWNAEGVKLEESQWFEGRLHGLFRRWDEAGRLVEEKRFKNGLLVEDMLSGLIRN
tara:strand:+ start:323 stop:853 length:531 start_codon:yes stop_codon:yes gene_type:complete